MRIPTRARLIEAFGDSQGTAAYRLLKRIDDARKHPAVLQWARECYHDPTLEPNAYQECLLRALDATLETCGVEHVNGRYVDRYWQECQALYANTGDTYANTIVYDTETDRAVLTSIGDWIETHPRRGIV